MQFHNHSKPTPLRERKASNSSSKSDLVRLYFSETYAHVVHCRISLPLATLLSCLHSDWERQARSSTSCGKRVIVLYSLRALRFRPSDLAECLLDSEINSRYRRTNIPKSPFNFATLNLAFTFLLKCANCPIVGPRASALFLSESYDNESLDDISNTHTSCESLSNISRS